MPKTSPAAQRPARTRAASHAPSAGRDGALHDRARHRDPAHRQQLVDVEVQPDAEHQQDHADLRELLGEC